MAAEDWVHITIDERLRLGPRGFARECGWELREDASGMRIILEENYYNRSPQLVVPRLVGVAPGNIIDREAVASWPPHDPYIEDDHALLDEHLRNLVGSGTREDFWAAFGLAAKGVADAEVPEFLQVLLQRMHTDMPDASVWAVSIDPKVFWRFGAIRSLFAGLETPEVLERSPEEPFAGFQAGVGLQHGTMFGLQPFLDVAMLVAAPWLLGIGSARRGGYLAALFGTREIGRRQVPAAEMLQLYYPPSFAMDVDMRTLSAPEFSPTDARAFFEWWVQRLNHFLHVLLDPSNFADPAGEYDVRRHMGAVWGVERLFQTLQGLLAHPRRDSLARLLYFFSLLDQLEGLRHQGFAELVKLPKVERELEGLKKAMPEDATPVVMTQCQRAVDGLRELGDGFHVAERRGDDGIRVKSDEGNWERQPVATAAAAYLRVLRNSTHSFGDIARSPREVSLLAAHDGKVRPAVPDLGLLHMLRFLSAPVALIPPTKRAKKAKP